VGAEPHIRSDAPDGEQATLVCLVPADRPDLRELLESYLEDVPGVEVVADRRGFERRSEGDRRRAAGSPPEGVERRGGDRRLAESGDRRAATARVERPVPLPPQAAPLAESVVFVERLEGSEGGDPRERLEQASAVGAKWRQRCLESEREAEELVRALVEAGEELRGMGRRTPRWLAAVKRADSMIDRYHRRRVLPQ
jgi:hypothetical protein